MNAEEKPLGLVTQPLLIDGWECRADWPCRHAFDPRTKKAIFLLSEGSLSCASVIVPPAVLAWLVAPLIDRGYGTGHAAGMATARELAADAAGFAAHRSICPSCGIGHRSLRPHTRLGQVGEFPPCDDPWHDE